MKKTNKGFSLVELIIVIAIMAILAGAIAPALIKYIDKSRKSNDVSSAKTIKTSIETALGNESAYEGVVKSSTTTVILDPDGTGSSLSSDSALDSGSISVSGTDVTESSDEVKKFKTLVGDALGKKVPKIKYKKSGMTVFKAEIDGNGNVKVGVATSASSDMTELTPEVADDYQ